VRKLLVIDTETGGLDANTNSLISLAAIVYNDGVEEAQFHEIIYDRDGVLDEDALKLNGFTWNQIVQFGENPPSAVQRLRSFLMRHEMYGKITLAGHNLPFDVAFLKRLYRLAGDKFDDQFYHGGLDTKSIALALEQAGRITIASSSLKDVATAYGVLPWREHDALADARATARVLKLMIDSLR